MSNQPSLITYVPQVSHGTILVTSRNRTAAFELVGDYENIIKLDPLDEDKSLDLMKAKLSVDAVMEEDAKNLLKALEYVPLAITQASAYIRENAPNDNFQIFHGISEERSQPGDAIK